MSPPRMLPQNSDIMPSQCESLSSRFLSPEMDEVVLPCILITEDTSRLVFCWTVTSAWAAAHISAPAASAPRRSMPVQSSEHVVLNGGAVRFFIFCSLHLSPYLTRCAHKSRDGVL